MTPRHGAVAVLIALTVLILPRLAAASGHRGFVVRLGIMEHASPTADRLRETDKVTMDPTRVPGFCFLVDPPSSAPYEVYSISYLPGAPSHLTGDFKGRKPAGAVRGVRSATQRVSGIRPFCFNFDPGDPLGEYRIEVFINGTRKTTLHLEVVAPSTPNRSARTTSSETSRTIAGKLIPSRAHPFTGFWRGHCADDFGLAIQPAGPGVYSISFCGPRGCFKPGTYRPNSAIVGDPDYRVLNADTIEVSGSNGFTAYHRCSHR